MNYELRALAIGGKLDGDMIIGQGEIASAHVQGEVSVTNSPIILASEKIERVFYKRMSIGYKTARGEDMPPIEFWVDAEKIKNQYDLILALARGYNPVVHDLRVKEASS